MFEKLEQWKEEYLFVKYVFLNTGDYSNIKISFPIGMFLILIAVAFTAAAFVINHRKNSISLCVRQLIRHGAVGEENAKTLKKLRLDGKRGIKRMLLSGGQLSSMVEIKGRTKPSYEEFVKDSKKRKNALEVDFASAEIYLKEEAKESAELIASKGESSILKPILVSAGFVLICAALFISMPEILELINSSITD
jgi:hypothetical protein